MEKIVKALVLGTVSAFLVATLIRSDKFNIVSKTIIRPAIDTKEYKLWVKVDGKDFCRDKDLSINKSPYDILGKLVDSKVDIVYLENVDILNCINYIQEISIKLHNYGLLLAMNIDLNFDVKNVLGENYSSFDSDYFTKRLDATKDAANWVSYFVFDDSKSLFTFNERRAIQSKLRAIYINSFIGFRFQNHVKPTPANTHPERNINWEEFTPKEDDGDFIITPIAVSGFKRTQVFTENLDLQESDGRVLEIAID